MNQTVSFPGLGLEFHFNNVAFHIASKPIYWYGILIMLGVILAVVYASARSRQFGIRQDDLYDAVLYVRGFIMSSLNGSNIRTIFPRFLPPGMVVWQFTAALSAVSLLLSFYARSKRFM